MVTTINNPDQPTETPQWLAAVTLEDLFKVFAKHPLFRAELKQTVMSRILEDTEKAKAEADIELGKEEGALAEQAKHPVEDPSGTPQQ